MDVQSCILAISVQPQKWNQIPCFGTIISIQFTWTRRKCNRIVNIRCFEFLVTFRRYLHKSYDFCNQSDALSYVEDEVKKFKEKNIGMKFLIVVGTYSIGKERVWSHIAQTFKMKVWLEAERRKAFNLIYTDENKNHVIKNCVSDEREEAQLHVLPLQCINYKVKFTFVCMVNMY